MLMAGEGPMCGMGDYELAQLGDGLDLYFRWLVSPSPSQVGGGEAQCTRLTWNDASLPQKYLSVLFLIMTIVAVPSIALNVAGTRVAENNRDPLAIVLTTAGNTGWSPGELLGSVCCR